MDIHHLKIFVAVYKNRSFSRASEKLFISQPTISEHVKNLEQELGSSLFDRLGRTILPTEAAELIYPGARKIIEDLDKIKETLNVSTSHIRGKLIIGASTIPGTYMLPRLASEFKNKYPDISFEIKINDTREICAGVEKHQLMLGIVGAREGRKPLKFEPFLSDELVYAVSPRLAAGWPDKSPGVIFKIPFLNREKGSGTRRNMETHLRNMGLDAGKLKISAVLGSTASVKEGIKAGLGGSILSGRAVAEELACGSIMEIKLDAPMKRTFYLTWLKKRTLPTNYRMFVDYCRNYHDEM